MSWNWKDASDLWSTLINRRLSAVRRLRQALSVMEHHPAVQSPDEAGQREDATKAITLGYETKHNLTQWRLLSLSSFNRVWAVCEPWGWAAINLEWFLWDAARKTRMASLVWTRMKSRAARVTAAFRKRRKRDMPRGISNLWFYLNRNLVFSF